MRADRWSQIGRRATMIAGRRYRLEGGLRLVESREATTELETLDLEPQSLSVLHSTKTQVRHRLVR